MCLPVDVFKVKLSENLSASCFEELRFMLCIFQIHDLNLKICI